MRSSKVLLRCSGDFSRRLREHAREHSGNELEVSVKFLGPRKELEMTLKDLRSARKEPCKQGDLFFNVFSVVLL